MNAPPKRIRRIRYSKTGKIRFTSHRDVARLWERTFRRAGIAVAYSEGFSPRPRISFGLALPTGYESRAEYLDVELTPDAASAPLEAFAGMVNTVLPSGMTAMAVGDVRNGAASLQEAVTSCIWEIRLAEGDPVAIDESIEAVLEAEELLVERERKGKTVVDDIRPLITRIERQAEPGIMLRAELGTKPRALRPDELLTTMGIPLVGRAVTRIAQMIVTPDARNEPLTAEASAVVHCNGGAT